MWHALRAELTYHRAYLLGGLGLAAGIATLVSVIFHAVGEEGPPSFAATGIRGMFFVMAPMIVGFIVQSFRTEERRARLLLAGPLTPKQIAGSMVLLTVFLAGIGIAGAGLLLGIEFLLSGGFESESLQIIGYVGGMLFAMMQLGLLVQESVVARGQQRSRAAAAGLTCTVLAVVLMWGLPGGALWGAFGWWQMNVGNLVAAFLAMIAAAVLYVGRTDFTR